VFRRIAGLCEEQVAPPAAPFLWNLPETRDSLERRWNELLSRQGSAPATEMMSYALTGGKCLRGLLLLAASESCGAARTDATNAAIAIEMLHAASLVVDDLPALDNAAVRRNAPSLHQRFGESAAILTAHALVAAAFEIVTEIPNEPVRLLRVSRLFASAIRSMANGELLAPCGDGSAASKARVRALKTGALFELAASIGALLAGADSELAAALARLGLHLGICYQVADDLRDDVMSEEERRLLSAESVQYFRERDRLFHSVRGRLCWTAPLEEWMSEFLTAGAEVGLP
jgi:geranylgeranyl pyrophosphate synthase